MVRRSRERLRTYWWLWVLIVGGVVVVNEVLDRKVAGDKSGHPAGDVLVAVVVVVITLAAWDLMTRSQRRARS